MNEATATLTKGERTRRRIVGHATQLIHDKGYRGTTIDDVIKAAGVTKGSFYFHFSSKEGLGNAVIDHASSIVMEGIKEAFRQKELTPYQRLELMLRGVQGLVEETQCTHGCIMGNLALELSHTNDGFRRKLAGVFKGWSSYIASELETMKESGELPKDLDTAAYADFMVSALEGGIMMSKVTLDPSPMRNSIDLILKQLDGMITR
jgi:TetR/AcrR family transcriptional repressor of nem operon